MKSIRSRISTNGFRRLTYDEHGNEYDAFESLAEYEKNQAEIMMRQVLKAVELKWITESCARTLIEQIQTKSSSWEDMFDRYEQLWTDYAFVLKKKDYYFKLEAVEKGYAFRALQTDPGTIERTNKKIKVLEQELEELA